MNRADLLDEIQDQLLLAETTTGEDLPAVRAALERFRLGSYGACSTCNKQIPLARLLSSPYVERCDSCDSRVATSASA